MNVRIYKEKTPYIHRKKYWMRCRAGNPRSSSLYLEGSHSSTPKLTMYQIQNTTEKDSTGRYKQSIEIPKLTQSNV